MTPIKPPVRGEAGVMTPSVSASRLGTLGPGRVDSASWRTELPLCLALLQFLGLFVSAKPGLTSQRDRE